MYKPAGISWRYAILLLLVVQNTALTLTLHYTRVFPNNNGGERYLTSTAIFLVEVIKLVVSLTCAFHDLSNDVPKSLASRVTHLCSSVFSGDSWKLAIPAVLYTLQSSLLYTAISNLDVATFQVNYQLKILTTALFSVSFLGKQLSSTKWLSLGLLAVGIAIVQIPEPAALLTLIGIRPSTSKLLQRDAVLEVAKPLMDTSKGLAAVIAAAVLSGATGVYFEKVVKDHSKSVSIWTRNVQLSFYSLFPAFFFGILYQDGAKISEHGFFVGYNKLVWVTILLQVMGGIVVALCIAHLDNIAKNFAVSVSIVCSFVLDVGVFGTPITVNFLCGATIVVLALCLYSKRPPSISLPK